MKGSPEKCLEKWSGKTIGIQKGTEGFCLILHDKENKIPIIEYPEQREIIVALIQKTGADRITI